LVLAKKKYHYYTGERDQVKENKNSLPNNNPNRKTNKKSHTKISIVLCIILIAAAMIFLLLRYTEITEIKYRINKINNEISAVETEIQHLKAELDQLIRSDIIEEKAIEDLNMQYPKYEQMVFLSLDSQVNTTLSLAEENTSIDNNQEENSNGIFYGIKKSFRKLYSLLD